MKPLTLTLENIGPFTATTHIDFERLGEMFLISGDTGSGKTTILDAMCYALYGTLAGTHTPNPRTLKSDFAREGDTVSVTFEFSVKGGVYKVTRTPPLLYTNRNGKLSEKPSEVCLYQKDADGAYTVVSGKTSEADAAIESLIGLSVEEFSRIVLLPQGDFAEFLHLSSNERRAALSKLFPVREYQEITAYVEEIAATYQTELNTVEKNIITMREVFDSEKAAEELTAIEESEQTLYDEYQKAQQALVELSAESEKAKRLYADIEEYEKAAALTQDLLAQEEHMQNLAHAITRAKAALNAEPFYKRYTESLTVKRTLEHETEETVQKLRAASEEETVLQSQKPQMQALTDRIKSLEEAIAALSKATETETQLKEAESELTALKQNEAELSAAIAQKESALLPLNASIAESAHFLSELESLIQKDDKATEALKRAQTVNDLAKEYYIIEEKCKKTEAERTARTAELNTLTDAVTLSLASLQELEDAEKKAAENDMALTLSLTLHEGTPCPVCGSTTHPSPAQKSARDLTLNQKLSAARSLYENATHAQKKGETAVTECSARLTELKAQLKDAESKALPFGGIASFTQSADTLQKAAAAKTECKTALTNAQRATHKRASDEQQKDAIERELLPLKAQKESTAKAVVQKQTEASQLLRSYTELTRGKLSQNESAQKAIDSFIKEKAAHEDTLKRFNAKTEENIRDTALLQGTLKQLQQQYQKAQDDGADAESALHQALTKNGFDSLDAFLSSFIEESTLKANEESHTAWMRALDAARNREESLRETLSTMQKPDIATIESKSAQTKEAIERITAERNALSGKKELLYDRQKQWAALEEKRATLTKESSLYTKLSVDLSGRNDRGLSFESWILGVYLEEITIHASRRLKRISDGRYTLLLKSEKASNRKRYSGLDLEIFDAFTGKKRACETLSGGETFLVSISLALALTDVVQSKSGGIQLDSLFIDEGFGTLDGTTLETALSVLDEIRESRTIGIISHVGELKNRIASRIEVHKTPTGSSVKIVG